MYNFYKVGCKKLSKVKAVKVNALMQIHFNCTNFINVRLMQCAFSVWLVA